MRKFYLIVIILFVLIANGQDNHFSSVTDFIDRSSYVQINLDENEMAVFKSGYGESVQFYPAEIIDLKQNKKMLGLNVVASFIVGQQGMQNITAREDAWIEMEEIGDMIVWLEQYVLPNLESSVGKKKTVKYIFNTKEITVKFEIFNNTQVFSVILNHSLYENKYFWTEAKVKDIPKVLTTLKYLQSKS